MVCRFTTNIYYYTQVTRYFLSLSLTLPITASRRDITLLQLSMGRENILPPMFVGLRNKDDKPVKSRGTAYFHLHMIKPIFFWSLTNYSMYQFVVYSYVNVKKDYLIYCFSQLSGERLYMRSLRNGARPTGL